MVLCTAFSTIKVRERTDGLTMRIQDTFPSTQSFNIVLVHKGKAYRYINLY